MQRKVCRALLAIDVEYPFDVNTKQKSNDSAEHDKRRVADHRLLYLEVVSTPKLSILSTE